MEEFFSNSKHRFKTVTRSNKITKIRTTSYIILNTKENEVAKGGKGGKGGKKSEKTPSIEK